MSQKERREYEISPHKKGRFMDVLKQRLDEQEFMEQLREAKLEKVERKLKNIENREVRRDKILEVLQKQVSHNTATTNVILKNLEKLQQKNIENVSGTTANIEKLHRSYAKLALVQENCQQRLSRLEEAAVASGSDRNTRTEGGGQPKKKKAPCSLCGKVLTVRYLPEHHRKNRCKQARAAAAMEEEAPESSLIITGTRSLTGTEFVIEEIPGDLLSE